MQAHYASAFDREMGCTEADWLGWLPRAVRGHDYRLAPGVAQVDIDAGRLVLRWTVLEPRRIALMTIPRLAVSFRFDGVDEAARQVFMRYFDLSTQRGGG